MKAKLEKFSNHPVGSKLVADAIKWVVVGIAFYLLAAWHSGTLSPSRLLLQTVIPTWLFLSLLIPVSVLAIWLWRSRSSSEGCTDKTLNELAKDQTTNLGSYVYIEIREARFQDDKPGHAWINFTFLLVNQSVYPIFLEDSIAGSIKLDGSPLQGTKVLNWKSINPFPVGACKPFSVQQWLLPDEVQWIGTGTFNNYWVNDLRFSIRTENGNVQQADAKGHISLHGDRVA